MLPRAAADAHLAWRSRCRAASTRTASTGWSRATPSSCWGAGPIGLLHLTLAKLGGARNIVVTNRSSGRRAVAQRVGATHVVEPDGVQAAVDDATGGRGADVVIRLCIGASELADVALQLARPGGRVSYFAGFPGARRPRWR